MSGSESPILSRDCGWFIWGMVAQEKAGRPVPPEFVRWIAEALGIWQELVSSAKWLEENP